MTDVVNGINSNEPYDYTQLKISGTTDKAGDGEQFSLAYQRAQEETEENDKGEKIEESGTKGKSEQRTVMQGGVKLELSVNSQKSVDAVNSGNNQAQTAGQGLIDTIKSWVAIFTRSLKDFFYKIWNDPVSPKDAEIQENASAAAETERPDGSERLSEEYIALHYPEQMQNAETAPDKQIEYEKERDKEIQRLLRSGNMEQVISLVTENGQKTMAKNSTLLTYYDRTGKIAPLSASDQERILHGDRSTRKL